jgi:serine O-acetyltransferase
MPCQEICVHFHTHETVNLSELFEQLNQQRLQSTGCLPPKAEAHAFADAMFNLLFPINCTENTPAEARHGKLRIKLAELLQVAVSTDYARAMELADAYFARLPHVYDVLLDDVEASWRFDPAAESKEEIITTYPGFYAIAMQRMAHELHDLGAPVLPRMLTEYAHSKTGIDIHPAAEIGRSFFIDHGTGIVIGATAQIGDNVKLYQGVTLGALQVEKSLASTKRHPTIESNVIIYANATILGGETVIGHDSIIGGNVFVTDSVPPFSLVYHKSQVSVRPKNPSSEINFVI